MLDGNIGNKIRIFISVLQLSSYLFLFQQLSLQINFALKRST